MPGSKEPKTKIAFEQMAREEAETSTKAFLAIPYAAIWLAGWAVRVVSNAVMARQQRRQTPAE